MFDDSLILRSGLEYKAELPDGHVVHYLSKETANSYVENRGARLIGPMFGPWMPECFKVLRAA